MKKFFLFAFAISLSFLFLSADVNAQISNGGTPASILFQVEDDYQRLQFSSPDMNSIKQQDLLDDANGGPAPRRMGVSVIIDKGIENSGTWSDLPGGDRIWRLEISVPNALALGVYYDDFFIPEGGQLFLYNDNRKQLIGAFTSENNTESNLFSSQFVQGDKVSIEYWQPQGQTENPRINISEVAYAYRDIEFSIDEINSAWACMINVACEEGDNWENQIKGVARMSIKIGGGYYWCSGSLINNTENDRTPYFLSAAHCGEGSSSADRNQWIFYFNYQASTCNGSSSGSNTVNGCTLKAFDQSFTEAGSDFYLVEFNQSIPNSYDVYYNGWNRTNDPEDAGSGVGIHHPAGDIKKISTYDSPLQHSTFWNGLPTHWKLLWAETANGRSIMQGGSSGSPIFDANGLIMGDLTGGYESNSCSSPSPAYYGKVYYSWDKNGTVAANRLKDWLDPNDIGIEKLQGVSWAITPPVADFSALNTTITQGDTIFFNDISAPSIQTREWSFEGGEPLSSNEQNPYVVYNETGDFDVSIYVENADGNDSELKEEYIHVTAMALPVADFEANETHVQTGTNVHFTDLTTNDPVEWLWEFEGGSPQTSTNQNPIVRWNSDGTYNVTLTSTNLAGPNTIIKEDYITVGGDMAMADFEASSTHIMQNETVDFTDLSTGDPNSWEWVFDGGTPATSNEQNPLGILYSVGGAFSVSLTVNNGLGDNTLVMDDYILVDWVGMTEFEGPNDFRVYPNPGSGIFVLEFAEVNSNEVIVEVTDYSGKLIQNHTTTKSKQNFVLDISSEDNGLYLITLKTKETNIVKKVSLVK